MSDQDAKSAIITSAMATPDAAPAPSRAEARRIRRFDNPWLNPKLFWGAGILLGIVLLGVIGRILWDPDLVFTGSAMLRQAPVGIENLRGQAGTWANPLGTDGAGRDILALLIIGAPNSLPSHYICNPLGPRNYDRLMPYVYHVHLRDTTPTELQVRIGQGEIEYGRLVNQLRQVKYDLALGVHLAELPGVDHMVEMRKMRLLLESLL